MTDKTTTIRFAADQLNAIDEAAEAQDLTRSAYVRQALAEYMSETDDREVPTEVTILKKLEALEQQLPTDHSSGDTEAESPPTDDGSNSTFEPNLASQYTRDSLQILHEIPELSESQAGELIDSLTGYICRFDMKKRIQLRRDISACLSELHTQKGRLYFREIYKSVQARRNPTGCSAVFELENPVYNPRKVLPPALERLRAAGLISIEQTPEGIDIRREW